MEKEAVHPCLTCGACCAFFRVSFYWREAEVAEKPDAVPVDLTEDYSMHHRAMKGTNSKHRCRCIALEGKVGESAQCSIYSLRPSPCRDFEASFEDGTHKPRCDHARAQYKLAPLRRADWEKLALPKEEKTAVARLPATESSCYTFSHDEKV